MPALVLDDALKASYQHLFDTCTINPGHDAEINGAVDHMIANRARYEAMGNKFGIPWYFVALTHQMEAGGSFNKHQHNGDPLTARTVQVPKGRPLGNPPFTWEQSAEDAILYQKLDKWHDWSVGGLLYQLEGYNGYGYHHHGINSPYLWSYTNHYTKGKYGSDSNYDPNLVSKQCGVATMLKRLQEKGQMNQAQQQPVPVDLPSQIRKLGVSVHYNPAVPDDTAKQLQDLLNRNGAKLIADGKAGKNTSDAYKAISGQLLAGDPRA